MEFLSIPILRPLFETFLFFLMPRIVFLNQFFYYKNQQSFTKIVEHIFEKNIHIKNDDELMQIEI